MEPFDALQGIENLTKFSGIAAVLGTVLLIFLVWRRTKSTHPLMSMLWRIADGKNKCSDKEINKFLSIRSSLMQFRFTTGIPIRLHSQISKLLEWSKNNEEDIGDIAGCGGYFDFEKPELIEKKIPKTWYVGMLILFGVFFLLFAITLGIAAIPDKAFLQIKESEKWVMVDTQFVKRISPFNDFPAFGTENCEKNKSDIEKRSGLNNSDINLMCNLLKDAKKINYLKETIREQRFIFLFYMVFILAFLPSNYKGIFNYFMAIAMRNRQTARNKAIRELEDYSV